MKIKFLFAFFLSIFFTSISNAQTKVATLFTDNMVLQQKAKVAIWGWDENGKNITITTSWNKKKNTVTTTNGKWKAYLETPVAGGPYEINISNGKSITLKNILIGEVWLCSGQSNMEMPMKGFKDQPVAGSNDAIFDAANNQIRLFTVPRSVQRTPQDTIKTQSWKLVESESVSNFSATAYYFGRLLQQKLQVPVGLINLSYGGSPVEAFMDEASLKEFADIKIPSPTGTEKLNNKNATTLYNGMYNGFFDFTVKGCIWYQGESNNDRAKQYETLFPAFVKMLRTKMNNDTMPFYYAQIAPYNYTNFTTDSAPKYNSAFLRDAQRKALSKIPNSGMICLMDIGEEFNIHPANKEIGGKRFAYLALAKTYQQKGFAYAGPMFDSISINGNVATIKMTNTANGFTSYGKPLINFEIAGSNKVFRPAKAVISQGKILVSSPEIDKPVAVRYAFKDFVVGDLFNTEGLPATSFRTDDW